MNEFAKILQSRMDARNSIGISVHLPAQNKDEAIACRQVIALENLADTMLFFAEVINGRLLGIEEEMRKARSMKEQSS